MPKTVGEFTYDNGSISGPAAFLQSPEWERTKERIVSGDDVVLAMCLEHAPDAVTGLLVFVQTCYAGWHGMEVFNRERGL